MTETARAAKRRVVVVGGGHAGGTFVGLLRQSGFGGEIVVIGDELDLPYQRPPLSKAFIGGDLEQPLRPPQFYREQNVTMRVGEFVVAIDRQARKVLSASGRWTAYDVLVLATGATARRLEVPGSGLRGVQTLRSLGDARVLRDGVEAGGAIVIVGGGYVGLEVAAVARANGSEVTVVEREDRILARVASPTFSNTIEEHHRLRGTRVRTDAKVLEFNGRRGRVCSATLDDGTELPCDMAIVGIGAAARDELAIAAGLDCDDGIVVDEQARTSDPDILAIGDATRRPVHGSASRMRLESIPSATEQAKQAVAAIVGSDPAPIEVPWFWSDQFDLKIKIAGIVRGPFETVVRGEPCSGKFALLHHDSGRLIAVEAANKPAEFMAGKRILAESQDIDPAQLADPGVELRSLLQV